MPGAVYSRVSLKQALVKQKGLLYYSAASFDKDGIHLFPALGFISKIFSPNDLLYKLVFPQVGKKFFPGQGQDVVGTGTYRILANQDKIFKYTFLF